MNNKEIQTVMTTRFTGSLKTVAAEANMKKPENPEEIIAKNTTRTIPGGDNSEQKTEKSCRRSGNYD